MTRKKSKQSDAAEAARPGLVMRRLSDIGYVLSVLLLIVAPLVATAGLLGWLGSQPVTRIEVRSTLTFVPRDQVMRTLRSHLTHGFNGMDLVGMRDALERLPWVESASLRRLWPRGLQVMINERIPLARWGAAAVVSFNGDLFRPRPRSVPSGLPLLSGPEDSVGTVVEHYSQFAEILGVAGLGLVAVAVDSRGAWRVELDNGVKLLLGRHRMDRRLWRLARVFTAVLKARIEDIHQVDLRYSNGFAVAWNASI